MPIMRKKFSSRSRAAFVMAMGLWLAAQGQNLRAQAGGSSSDADPAPLALIMTRLDRGDEAGAERLMRDNLAVTKRRMEARLAQLDEKFDEAGRYGATAGHEVHTEVLENLMNDVNRDRKLFDLYRKLTGDEIIYKRLEARRLRFEGALYTHEGEDACGETLNWEEAQRLYNLALERLEAGFALAKEVKETRVMASAKNNVGSTLIRLLQPEKALVAYQEGMQYAQQLPGEMYKGLVNLNLGNTYVWIGDPETSLRYSEPALASFKKMGRATWQANAVMNIGNAYMREQKYSMAWEHLRMALDLAKQSGEDRVRGRALLNLGMIAYQLKKPEAAAFVQQALDWFAKEGSEVYTTIEKEVVQQDGLRLLSRIAKGNGDEAAAKKYDRQFLDLINTDPDRYGKLRASPCFAIYQARPAGQPIAQK